MDVGDLGGFSWIFAKFFGFFRKMALRVGVDAYVEKGGNLHLKFFQILIQILNHQIGATNVPALKRSLSRKIAQIRAKEVIISEMGYSYIETTSHNDIQDLKHNGIVDDFPSTDANDTKFQQLLTDPAWVRQNLGKYVAFADGEVLRTSRDDTSIARDELLLWLTNSKEYASSNRFFARVENETRSSNLESIDEPSSFLFDGFSF